MIMATKKTETKKAPAKAGTPTKVGTPAKAGAKAAAKPKPKAAAKQTRRPPNNPDMPDAVLGDITGMMDEIKTALDNYAAHLRALDRKRLNGVGIKKQGFIERAFEYALSNPEFLPHYLTLAKFREDNAYFTGFRNLFDLCKQIQEIIWNITMQASDIVYTDALEYYASVREAAKRRVDAAETIHKDLEIFFKKTRRTPAEEPTEKELKRDIDSLLRGRKDGKVVVENVRPKLSGGARKVVDEHFTDSGQFKETEEGEV
jgi:hypothetical protein